jgi:hypothetical protein
MQIKIVDNANEPLNIDAVKKAIAALPDHGGVWNVDNPQDVVAAFEEICVKINAALESQRVQEKENFRNVGVKYEAEDETMLDNLNKLFEEWENGLTADEKTLFNRDGFYPGYNHQKVKILFVGREACYMAGKNYAECMYASFKKGYVGKWTVNQYPFHRRQAYIAYGIFKAWEGDKWRWPSWSTGVPWASEICKGVGGKEKISWALINLSKLSNETGDWRTDSNRYWPFVKKEKNQKRLKEQISILNPDIIIGGNVQELVDILGYKESPNINNANCYAYYEEGLPLFLNCYHFAAIKSDEKCFYEPVGQVLEKYRDIVKRGARCRNEGC